MAELTARERIITVLMVLVFLGLAYAVLLAAPPPTPPGGSPNFAATPASRADPRP